MDRSSDEAGEGAPNLYEIMAETKSLGRKSDYTVEQKMSLLLRYVVTGNLTKACEEQGVPYQTAIYWKRNSEWWDTALRELRKRKQDDLDGTLTGIIHDITEAIVDRIKNGDSTYDSKIGQVVRIPMKGKELATTLGILFDKRAAMRGDPSHITKQATSEEQLQLLKDQFKDFSKQLQDAGHLAKPIDGETDGD